MHKYFSIFPLVLLFAAGCRNNGNVSVELTLEGVTDSTEIYVTALSETTATVDTLFPGVSGKSSFRKVVSVPV